MGSSPNRLAGPGDTDPAIPIAMAEALSNAALSALLGGTLQQIYVSESLAWIQIAVGMSRAGQTPWWGEPLSLDQMIYECDKDLGSPSVMDCTQIEWNQLGPQHIRPLLDTITVEPGAVQFFHSSKPNPKDAVNILPFLYILTFPFYRHLLSLYFYCFICSS